MAALGIGGLALMLDQTFRAQETMLQTLLQTRARSVSASFKTFDHTVGQHPINDIVAELSLFSQVETLHVFDAHGRIRWSSSPRTRGKLAPPAALHLLSQTATAAPVALTEAGPVQVVAPLRRTSGCLPCHKKSSDPIGGIYLATGREQLFKGTLGYSRRAAVIVIIGVVLLTALLLVMINRMVVQPLSQLERSMAKAEEGDFMARAEVRSEDELGLLARRFNALLAKITDLRVERIETEREMHEVMDELSLKRELSQKTELLAAANERLEAQIGQLSFLNQLGRDLASKLDLDYLLDRFTERVGEALKVPELALLLFDQRQGKIEVIKARGFSDEDALIGQPFDLSAGISGDAVLQRKPIYLPNVKADPRNVAYRQDQRATGSLFCVPLMYQEQVIGVLNFSSPLIEAFSEVKRELFVTVANQAALALANARLFQETLELSMTDGLTGVLNRRAMQSRLELEWSRASRDQSALGVVMLDIDHFKDYNDQQGHQLGDETLRRVAQIVQKNIRRVDALARYGGEEFLVILPRAEKREAVEVAKKLRRAVEQTDFVRGYMQPLGRVTISCGVASGPEDSQDIESLIKRADEALYKAKQSGRNRVCTVE